MSLDAEVRRAADQEATDWLLRLREAEDAEVYEAFEAWIVAAPANASAWAELGRVSQTVTVALEQAGAAPARTLGMVFQRRRNATARGRQIGPRLTRRTAVAAVAASIAAMVAVAVAPDAVLSIRSDYMSGVHQLRTVQLQDGSVLTLAPRSAVSVDFEGETRRVRLLRGDAYFEVARNPDRPFTVSSSRLKTTVLGTGFEVRSASDQPLVGVRHGRVRVQAETGASRELTSGEGVHLGPTGDLQLFETDPENVAAWRRKQLIVEGRPVAEVVDALRPWYGGVILARGHRLNSDRVTGVYDLNDPVGALTALSRANGASVQRISPWIMTISFD
jgi:transmembrane sensor